MVQTLGMSALTAYWCFKNRLPQHQHRLSHSCQGHFWVLTPQALNKEQPQICMCLQAGRELRTEVCVCHSRGASKAWPTYATSACWHLRAESSRSEGSSLRPRWRQALALDHQNLRCWGEGTLAECRSRVRINNCGKPSSKSPQILLCESGCSWSWACCHTDGVLCRETSHSKSAPLPSNKGCLPFMAPGRSVCVSVWVCMCLCVCVSLQNQQWKERETRPC